MTIIEKMREILHNFPKISEVCDTVHVDFTSKEPTSYGLSSISDVLLSEDVLGGQIRQHTFFLYSTYSSINDYERLLNSMTLVELGTWLENQTEHEVITGNREGEIIKITTSNGQLYAVPQENEVESWQYQLQIVVQYTVDNN